uniref:ESPR-type extended signal peptide-containing protein n=1 Tax=Neisseria sicca TaxID=490 RepID=UPI0011BD035A
MNKIFKVVWNRTIGSFVVTSELAKGRVKSSSEGAEGDVRASEEGRLKTLFRLTALSAALFGLSESAWAHPIINSEGGKVATGSASETAIGGGSARGVGSVAVGAFAKAGTRIEADGAVAIGGSQASTGAYADGNNAIAIGQASNANAAKAISIGSDTIASHEWTSAYGGRAEAKNLGATALGSWTQASGQFSIAVGGGDRFGRNNGAATIASGDRSTAIGRNAKSDGADAIALGTGAQATLTNSIAIGKNSVATGVNNIAKNPVNVGNAVAIGSGVQALGEDSVAIGVSAGANLTTATTKQSLAIGWTAKATGLAQAVAIGPDAIASGAQSTSIGNNTRAIGDSSIAIGGDDWNVVRTKQVAAAGNKQVHQVFEELTGMPMKQQGEAYKNPFKGTTAGDAAVAIGVTALAEGVLSTAFGSGTSASGIGAAAFGVGATASQDKSVAIGAGSHTRTDATAVTEATVNGVTYRGFAGTEHITTGSQVSFGSAGYERQLKHVAPGAITPTSTDAINGSQLYALHVGAGNIAKSVADALGGGATVGNDPTNNQGSFVTLPSYDVLKGSDKPNTAGNGTAKFNTTPAKNVAAAMTNLNTYVNQGFAVKDNAGDTKGIVTPGESVQFADGNATTVTVDTEANGNTKIKYDVKVDDSTIKVVDGKLTGASQTHFYSVNSADKTKANYNNDGATGENAIAAGPEAKAAASNAVVIGSKATVEAAAGSDSTINGETTGEGSVAVGALSKASGKNATAIGQKANAYGQNSFAGGQDTESSGKSSVAVGDGSRATDNSTTAVGPYAKATKAGASAFGFNANAQAIGSVAVGRQAQALNLNAVSVGNESKAKGEDTVAIGTSADAVQNRAMAIGKGAVANGADTIAFGAATKADQRYAIAIGSGNNAWKEDSVALGRAANADGAASLALGLSSHTREANAIALGNNANADDTNSIAIGTNSKAAQAAAVTIGNNATALKSSAVVIGEEAKSNNSRSVVIGYYASATNPAMSASNQDTNQTVAIGAYANAWGDQSTAIGNNVDAKGNSSIAIGADDWDTVAVKTVEGTGKTVKEVYQDYTGDVMETGSYTHTTSSEAAVAIGTKSQATGELSTAFGTGTRAEGVASAAFGMGAKATQGNSVAIGAGSTTTTGATSVNEATVNNLKYSGFAGGNSVNPGDQVSFGSKNYERQLKNVAPGEISNTSTDAINGSQLYAVQNVLGNTAQTVKNVLGGDAAVDENGSITMSNIGNTGAGNIHDAIKSVKETAEKGWKLKANDEADSESEKIAAGDTVTVKQGKNIRVKRSSKELTIETADDVAFNKVTVGASELTTTGLTTPQVTAGDSVLGNNGLTIANGANPVSLTKDGLNNGGNKVTNIADGVADTDAASYKQVKAAKTEVQKGTNVVSVDKTEGTDGHAIYTVNAKGTAVSAEGTENGLKLTSSEDSTTNVTTYNLDLSDKTKDSLKKADSALQGIDVKVNDENVKTLTKDDSTLKFVNGTGTTAENKGGTVTFNVNKSTLTTGAGGVVSADTAGDVFATAADVAKAINKAVVDSEKTSVVAAGDNTHVAAVEAGNQTTYTVHADNTTVSVKDGGKLALKSSEATNSNHTKTTNYELDLSDDTKAEIQKGVDAKNIVDTKGITFSGNSGSPVTKKLDETLAIKGDDTNVVTESGTDGITVKLKDEITVQTVNADKLKAGDSVLTNDGLNIANGNNPVSLTKSGLSNGGNKITKVAKGENEDDAVNYAQLKELAEKGLTFDADGNTSTSSKKLGERVGIKGGNNITTSADNDNVTVKLNDDITLNSVTATTLKAGDSTLTNAGLVTPKVTAGDSVLTTDGLNIANGAAGSPVSLTKDGLNNGGNKVTSVAKGTADTDGVNVSQLNPVAKALNTNIDPTTGEVAAPSFTVTKADGTKHPAVGTVQDALDKVGEEVTKGLNIVADNGSSEKVNLGDTVTYTSKDKNIVTTSGTGKAIDFSLAEKVTIGKDAANGGKPVVIDGKEGIVSGLTNTTLGAAPLAGSNKAATEAQLDATQVNLKNILGGEAKNENGNVSTEDIGGTGENNIHDAIKSVKATADKGWKLKANDEADSESEKIAAGDTVTVKQGKNIRVKRSGKDLTIETEDDVAFNKVTVGASELTTTGLTTPKVTAGDSVLTTDGLNIANGAAGSPVSLTKDGLNNGGNKVTSVAKGTADTDGVNVSQLNPVAKALNTNIDPTTGEVAAPSFTVTKADGTKHPAVGTVQDALDKVGEEVTKGLNIVADNGSSEKVNLGDTVTYTSKDKNIVTTSGTGKAIDFSLAEKVTIGKDAANGGKPVVIDGKEGIVSGLTNTTLGAAPLAGSNKAATEAQLDATQVNLKNILGGEAKNENGNVSTEDIGGTGENNIHDAIKSVKATADKGWKLKANDEADSESEKIAAGDTVTFKEGKNVKVSRNGKSITIATSDDVSFKTVTVGDSVLTDNGLTVGNGKAGKPVSLTKDGLNNGGNKIANVAAGEADTDAVNVAQLKAAAAKATSKVESGNGNIVVTPEQNADGSTTYKVATTPNLKADSFTAGDTVVNKDGVKVGDKVALGRDGLKAGDVNITADGINAGNKAISNVAEGKKDTDAVNVAQLKAAAAKATSKVESGNDNIVVTPEQNADGSTTYKVATAPDLKADSLTTGDTVVNNDGVKVGDKVALTKDGLDNGGNKVANVAAGEADTDAVNVAQLKSAAAKATSKVDSGNDNIVVTPEQNADGSTTYKVATAPNLKADSFTAGDTVVNNDGVKVGDK